MFYYKIFYINKNIKFNNKQSEYNSLLKSNNIYNMKIEIKISIKLINMLCKIISDRTNTNFINSNISIIKFNSLGVIITDINNSIHSITYNTLIRKVFNS